MTIDTSDLQLEVAYTLRATATSAVGGALSGDSVVTFTVRLGLPTVVLPSVVQMGRSSSISVTADVLGLPSYLDGTSSIVSAVWDCTSGCLSTFVPSTLFTQDIAGDVRAPGATLLELVFTLEVTDGAVTRSASASTVVFAVDADAALAVSVAASYVPPTGLPASDGLTLFTSVSGSFDVTRLTVTYGVTDLSTGIALNETEVSNLFAVQSPSGSVVRMVPNVLYAGRSYNIEVSAGLESGATGTAVIEVATAALPEAGTFSVNATTATFDTVGDVEFTVAGAAVSLDYGLVYVVSAGRVRWSSVSPSISGIRLPPGVYPISMSVCEGFSCVSVPSADGGAVVLTVSGARSVPSITALVGTLAEEAGDDLAFGDTAYGVSVLSVVVGLLDGLVEDGSMRRVGSNLSYQSELCAAAASATERASVVVAHGQLLTTLGTLTRVSPTPEEFLSASAVEEVLAAPSVMATYASALEEFVCVAGAFDDATVAEMETLLDHISLLVASAVRNYGCHEYAGVEDDVVAVLERARRTSDCVLGSLVTVSVCGAEDYTPEFLELTPISLSSRVRSAAGAMVVGSVVGGQASIPAAYVDALAAPHFDAESCLYVSVWGGFVPGSSISGALGGTDLADAGAVVSGVALRSVVGDAILPFVSDGGSVTVTHPNILDWDALQRDPVCYAYTEASQEVSLVVGGTVANATLVCEWESVADVPLSNATELVGSLSIVLYPCAAGSVAEGGECRSMEVGGGSGSIVADDTSVESSSVGSVVGGVVGALAGVSVVVLVVKKRRGAVSARKSAAEIFDDDLMEV